MLVSGKGFSMFQHVTIPGVALPTCPLAFAEAQLERFQVCEPEEFPPVFVEVFDILEFFHGVFFCSKFWI